MIFRKSTMDDISTILKIIEYAQKTFKSLNINQWQDGYPNYSTIERDISLGESFVLAEEGKILATTALSFRGEPSYDKIYEGNWLDNQAYAVVHRMAVAQEERGKGYSYLMFDYIENICLENNITSIRVDTHVDNIPMKSLIKKLNFSYCGIILLDDGDERLAYEKLLNK